MSFQRQVQNHMAFMDRRPPQYTSAAAIVAILLLWELLCRVGGIPDLFLPSPTAIIQAGYEMLLNGELLTNTAASLMRIGIGFIIGSTIGIILGLIIGFSTIAEAVGNPIVYALYPVPKLALLPLIILWLGIGELSKVTIISLGVFFPVIINTYSGVKNVDPMLIKVAVSFNTSRSNIIRKVILPGALPVIFAGLKLAAGTALLLLVAAEMIAAKEGIGAMILHYGDLMLTNKLMAGVVVLSLLGLVFNHGLYWLERLVVTWKR